MKKRVVIAGLGDTGLLVAMGLAADHDVIGITPRPALVSGQEVGLRVARPNDWRQSYLIGFERYRSLRDARVVHGLVERVELTSQQVVVRHADASLETLSYDALVLTPDALGKGVRTFSVLCDSRFLRYVQVPITDSLLDPRTQITRLRNGLQLIRPVVAPDPVVASVGGLVTRYPAWLSIRPEAWVPQRSNTTSYRGTLMVLLTTPKRLEFVVDFVPNRDKPSPSFKGIVTCVPTVSPIAAEGSLPARPALPDTAEPGVTGPCTWTPPGPGTVTITARTIHGVTFWADGIAVPEADYVFESLPATFTVGELVAVNTPP